METSRKQTSKDKFTWHNALQTSGSNRACVDTAKNCRNHSPIMTSTATPWAGKHQIYCCRYQTGHHWDKIQLMRMQRNLHNKKLQGSKTTSTIITLWESCTKCQTIITFFITRAATSYHDYYTTEFINSWQWL
jgi:hypothetical protein